MRYHLGTDEEHTVYEAETLGLTVAAQLIATGPNIMYPISILLDNQAAIECRTSTSKEGSGFLARQLDRMTRHLAAQRKDEGEFNLTLRCGYQDTKVFKATSTQTKKRKRPLRDSIRTAPIKSCHNTYEMANYSIAQPPSKQRARTHQEHAGRPY